MTNQLISLHETYDYRAIVHKLKDKNGISIQFPVNILRNPRLESETWFYDINGNNVEKRTSISDKSINIDIPVYAQRLVILEDILLHNTLLGIHSCLILCYDNENKLIEGLDSLVYLLDAPDEKNQQLENVLTSLFIKLMDGTDSKESAKTTNTYDGYNLILQLLQNGGLL